MHHALEIQDILSIIFLHCSPPGPKSAYREEAYSPSDLPILARTCRAFKETALDLLWKDLSDLSPLLRCLPEISHQVSPGISVRIPSIRPVLLMNLFSFFSAIPGSSIRFARSLTQTEWDTLQSYTYRIRSIRISNCELDEKSLRILSNPPTTAPLFPNLHTLRCEYTENTMSLLHLPLPSLISLDVWFKNLRVFRSSLKLFPNFSPNIRTFRMSVSHLGATFSGTEPDYMRRQQSLCSVDCDRVTFDMDTLVHLSRMSSLTHLNLALSATSPLAGSDLLIFSHLHDLALLSDSLETISQFLSRVRLPAIINFRAVTNSCPSRQEFSYFSAGLRTCNAGHTIEGLKLDQRHYFGNNVHSGAFLLCLEDLRPFMAFSLRQLTLDIECNVGLSDSELLTLASAWPQLEKIFMNVQWGWNMPSGITPSGLLQLLQICRPLSQIGLAINTRDYTECRELSASPRLTLPPDSDIRIPDSMIEADCVLAVATFFGGLMPCSNFSFSVWGGWKPRQRGGGVYKARWGEVHRLIKDAVNRRS